jgi:hypothetical protein
MLLSRQRNLRRLESIEAALAHHDVEPTGPTRESLEGMAAMLRKEIGLLERAWRAQGPSLN